MRTLFKSFNILLLLNVTIVFATSYLSLVVLWFSVILTNDLIFLRTTYYATVFLLVAVKY